MNYEDFFECLKKNETNNVKALFCKNSCALAQIPKAFCLLMPNIVNSIQNHLYDFCQADEIVALFGLQVTTVAIESELPLRLHRIHCSQYPGYHFCVSLIYLIFKSNQRIHTINNWQNYRALVVDFTTGKLMDEEHFLFLALGINFKGKVYGEINPYLLENIWKIAFPEEEYVAEAHFSH